MKHNKRIEYLLLLLSSLVSAMEPKKKVVYTCRMPKKRVSHCTFSAAEKEVVMHHQRKLSTHIRDADPEIEIGPWKVDPQDFPYRCDKCSRVFSKDDAQAYNSHRMKEHVAACKKADKKRANEVESNDSSISNKEAKVAAVIMAAHEKLSPFPELSPSSLLNLSPVNTSSSPLLTPNGAEIAPSGEDLLKTLTPNSLDHLLRTPHVLTFEADAQ